MKLGEGVYLIHFDPPYKHAGHYLGYSPDVLQRFEQHKLGMGARLTQVAVDAGCKLLLVRTWLGQGRTFERRMKGRGLSRLCPICSPDDYIRMGHVNVAEAHRRNMMTERDPLTGKFKRTEVAV